MTFSRKLERAPLPEPIVLEPEQPELPDIVADVVVLVTVPAVADEDMLAGQVDELVGVSRIREVGLMPAPGSDPELLDRLGRRPGVSFVCRSDLTNPVELFLLLRRAGSATRLVLTLEGTHRLSASSVRNYLRFHEQLEERESEFTPGPHESYRSAAIARCVDVASLATRLPPDIRRMVRDRRRAAAVTRVRILLGWLPGPVKHALRPLAIAAAAPREAATPQPAAADAKIVLAGDGAVTAGTAATPAPTVPVFLGTPRDQIELLADRAREFHPFPRVVNLVLTNLCNLSCVMCPYHSPRYEKGEFFKRAKYMSDAIFEQVAREAAAHRATLKLGQLEEVLIHPRLIPWIEQARDLGVPSVHITTNGTLLTPDKSEALMKAGLTTIYVSLDAATPETYQTVRGWKGGLEKVWENIDALIENRDRFAPETGIHTSFILQPEAAHERDAFVEMWRERGIDGVIVYQLSEHYNEGKTDFKTKFFDPTPPERRHACSSVWEEIYVYPLGEVSMCCNTMILVPRHGVISMGNVTKRPLEEIWLGAQYRDLRRRLLLNDIAGDVACQDCDIWDSSETRVEERDGMRVLMNPTSAIYSFR